MNIDNVGFVEQSASGYDRRDLEYVVIVSVGVIVIVLHT